MVVTVVGGGSYFGFVPDIALERGVLPLHYQLKKCIPWVPLVVPFCPFLICRLNEDGSVFAGFPSLPVGVGPASKGTARLLSSLPPLWASRVLGGGHCPSCDITNKYLKIPEGYGHESSTITGYVFTV